MARGVGYQQYCPMATALDVVGDRWALLVVRDLILGPRRFTELMAGLPGVGTDILTARLRSLEAAGAVERLSLEGRPVYRLTASGRRLRPVLAELARWGAFRLAPPVHPEDVAVRVGLTTLVLDPRQGPRRLSGRFRIEVGDQHAWLSVDGGCITVTDTLEPGASDRSVETVVELTFQGLLRLLAGRSGDDVEADGDATISGDRRRALQLLDTLSAPEVLAGVGLEQAGNGQSVAPGSTGAR